MKTPIVPLPPKVVRARLAATAMALLLLAGVALQVQASYNAAVAAAETTARALVKAVAIDERAVMSV
ncbi:MAG TPA: hypothetical protein PKZ97_15080 [Azospirillaceae bacterium]|nr:hypothetical protein [Azospirillaceae bacterium]